MPETQGGVPIERAGFTKPPSGALLSQEDLKQIAAKNKEAVSEAAEALGGSVLGTAEAGKHQRDASTHDEDPELVDVPIEDRRNFIRTMLAGDKFSKTYTIFGSAVKLTFATRTTAQNRDIAINAENPVDREQRRMQCSLAEAAYAYSGSAGFPSELDSMNDILYAAVLKEFRKFEALCDLLFKKADDPNFWTEIGGLS